MLIRDTISKYDNDTVYFIIANYVDGFMILEIFGINVWLYNHGNQWSEKVS